MIHSGCELPLEGQKGVFLRESSRSRVAGALANVAFLHVAHSVFLLTLHVSALWLQLV